MKKLDQLNELNPPNFSFHLLFSSSSRSFSFAAFPSDNFFAIFRYDGVMLNLILSKNLYFSTLAYSYSMEHIKNLVNCGCSANEITNVKYERNVKICIVLR